MRVSSEEREHAVERLREHYYAGRLSSQELEVRVHDAYSAVEQADLERLLRDLPSETKPAAGAPDPRRRRLAQLVAPYLLTSVFLIAIWAISGRDGSFWPIWPILVFGLIVGRRALRIYNMEPPDRGERKEIER
jgi:hypothetical protein